MAKIVTEENINEILGGDKPAMLDFWAPWCGPCRMMLPVIEEMTTEFEGKAVICKVNCDEQGELATKYSIRSIPSFVFIKNGEVVETVLGAVSKKTLVEKLNKLI